MTKAAVFQDPMFLDEGKAREALEAVRWPEGTICPHCGNSDPNLIAKVEGKKHSHRPGLYYCNECKGQFTVTVGTVFERSKVPLTKWWMAAHLMNAGKNGVSAHEIHRALGVTYKTAWFMMQRLREAMIERQARSHGPTRRQRASGRNLSPQYVEARQGLQKGPLARPQSSRCLMRTRARFAPSTSKKA